MPRLDKSAVANFFRSDCERRLRLDLTPESFREERREEKMPPRLPRPGLNILATEGERWETEKTLELQTHFGEDMVIGVKRKRPRGEFRYEDLDLKDWLNECPAPGFLAQARYAVTESFLTTHNIGQLCASRNLKISSVRPDLLMVVPAGTDSHIVMADGSTQLATQGDSRRQIRVVDIKLTAEPAVPHFIEVTYYAMVLAGWLLDHDLDDGFVVSSRTMIWPGSHVASELTKAAAKRMSEGVTASRDELLRALDEDLADGEFEVFAPRLKRFLREQLPYVLAQSWKNLNWHVDNRCIGCDYLGYPWDGQNGNPSHCWPMAEATQHLSRVAFIGRGATAALMERNVESVPKLASLAPTHAAFDGHHTLRAGRHVVPARAQALGSDLSGIPSGTGTSAILPRWADLRIYLVAEFDVGSGISSAFGFKAYWAANGQRIKVGDNKSGAWQASVFPVDEKSVEAERRELLALLERIHESMSLVEETVDKATVQVYLWDQVTYDHLVRVIGRHLEFILRERRLHHLAWLFPPDTLVANPELSDRGSPISLVREAVRSLVAAPIPHYYSLLTIARQYHALTLPEGVAKFSMPPLFEDPLSDHIPSERAHEIWSRNTRGKRTWELQLASLQSAVKKKLSALETVTNRITSDLKSKLGSTAPRISSLRPPKLSGVMADDSRLWYVFTQLDAALKQLKVQKTLAMPSYEREARYASAHLVKRLGEVERKNALADLRLADKSSTWIYAVSPNSREVKLKVGDFAFALSPRTQAGVLEKRLATVARGQKLPIRKEHELFFPMAWVASARVLAIDRERLLIAVAVDDRWRDTLLALEARGRYDLGNDVMLDPTFREFLLPKLEETLRALGNPPVASKNAKVSAAIGKTRKARPAATTPASQFLWSSRDMVQSTVAIDAEAIKDRLREGGFHLNSSQWQAWRAALGRRLHLIWGPPGTGKSRTLQAVVLGAILDALEKSAGCRVLITGPTYEAIDQVFLGVADWVQANCPGCEFKLHRLRSQASEQPSDSSAFNDVVANGGSSAYRQLQADIANPKKVTIVGATAQQTQKLLMRIGKKATAPLFDLVIIDEASQLDVATATLPIAGLTEDSRLIIAGDPMQLPPIHEAKPPIGLEAMVGPVFTYFTRVHGIEPSVLQTNYRSNAEIVRLAHFAGYPSQLFAQFPDLRIVLAEGSTAENSPIDWPDQLAWLPGWGRLLDPELPVVAFVYDEGRSSQWNPFEAGAVASLTWYLRKHLGSALSDGGSRVSSGQADCSHFWGTQLGVVTPHRAQKSRIVDLLQGVFPEDPPALVRSAVDTVERFQGQQRDVMIASFAVGDPDAIRDEDEFLQSLNRFNVMTSRARAKIIVLVSQQLIDHLSDDADVLHDSRFLKGFAEVHCQRSEPLTLAWKSEDGEIEVHGDLRYP